MILWHIYSSFASYTYSFTIIQIFIDICHQSTSTINRNFSGIQMLVISSITNIKNRPKFLNFPFLRNLSYLRIFEFRFFHTFQSLFWVFSSTTHTPALTLPSCRMMPAFCITDKSRSIVRCVTDKVSDISFPVTNGLALMVDKINR